MRPHILNINGPFDLKTTGFSGHAFWKINDLFDINQISYRLVRITREFRGEPRFRRDCYGESMMWLGPEHPEYQYEFISESGRPYHTELSIITNDFSLVRIDLTTFNG